MSRALVVNAGSTSLKLSVVDDAGDSLAVASLAGAPRDVDVVAHRVVHGGRRFRAPVLLDKRVLDELDELTELAPLHNGPALRAIADARAALPDLPHVAVFDTAFHATIPELAFAYAVPEQWREAWGIRRYGFHGLSVQWAAEQVRVERLVVCHLGGGCSVTAVRDGRSIDTTMGFSPLEGVPMATRSGSIDAEAVLHLLRTGRRTLAEIEHDLEHESGLLGLSGASARVEELESLATPAARRALDVFAYRVALAVGASAAALLGLDALVFTGGVGEGSARVRADVCARLTHLGVELDPATNGRGAADAAVDVQAPRSRVRVAVVRAREDVVAARAALAVLAAR
ncbi:MAG TPA: acetate/propionate family kinase [Gaiellaceae bacterium]|nr:acetate/propionate family kinase [Gaiellaceae bacterium]